MKQIFPKLAMTVAVLLSFLPASAYDFEVDGIYYNITDATNQKVAVTYLTQGTASYSGDINIPSTVINEGTSYSVTAIGDWAFFYCTGLTSVTIPNSVTSIGKHAFRECIGLTNITVPNSVTSIGAFAFGWCSGLIAINVDSENKSYISIDGVLFNKNLTAIIQYPAGKPGTTFSIPSSVTSIGGGAFYGCTGLTSVIIPNLVTSIGYGAFSRCIGLASVTIPNLVTSIGDEAFSWCSGLTSVTIPNSVTSIGYGAFYECDGLTSATIGSSVTSIGDWAFRYCSGLTSMTIPNSVTSIGDYAFHGCTGLVAINVDTGNKSYISIDGVLYNKNLTDIIQYPAGKPGTTFSIPSSVTSIGGGAFSWCPGLTSVTIPNSVTSIGDEAFNGCPGLTSITLPNSVTSIGDDAFSWCIGLGSITLPNSVIAIGDFAFAECPLRSVYCSWNVPLECGNYLFSTDCYKNGTLYVPEGCADKYRLISPWSKFKTILEDESLGVEDIVENQPAGDYIVYDLQGTLRLKAENIDEVNQLPAGLYIVNGKRVLIR